MANTFAPFGFQVLGQREGSQPQMGQSYGFISSTDQTMIFSGDPVQLLGTAVASGGVGLYITQGSSSAGTNPIVGVFTGCRFFNTVSQRWESHPYWPGSGASSASDPIAYFEANTELKFIAQASTAATIGASQVGMGVSITANASAGNTATGMSVIAIQSTGTAALTTSAPSLLPFKIRDFYSNSAPPGLGGLNGTDNTSPGQLMIVEPLNWTGGMN